MLGAITQKHNLDKEEESDDEFEPIDPSIQNRADEEMDTDLTENTQTSSNAEEDSDNSSESDSDDDSNQPEDEIGEDEYMELLETQFTMLSNKNKKDEKVEMARQELHFKMRVLDLLEAFLEKENESIFIPQFFVPLMLVLRNCYKDIEKGSGNKGKRVSQKSFLDRLTRVITKKILQKPFVRGEDVLQFNGMLHGIIDTLVDNEILSSPIPQHEEIGADSISR